ncbi:MAG: Hsp20/alpha crystallin family protein [Myxococcota bacterium]
MLTRFNPFEEMQRLQDEFFRPWGTGGQRLQLRPAVDIYEDEGSIKVTAELPGVRPEDLDIQVEDNVLTLSGERRLEHEDHKEGYHRIERAYGSFSRSFALPRTVDSQAIQAELRNGTLVLTMPKRAESQPRRIEVKGSETPAEPEAASGRKDVEVRA